MSNRALFLDRDGVINVNYGYVYLKSNFVFVDGIFSLVKKANDLGYEVFVVTNQSGIARGYYTEAQFLDLSSWMVAEFKKHNCVISQVYYCPYHIDGIIPEFTKDSEDRKPKPGMLLKAAVEHDVDLANSIMVGDRDVDILAAKSANVGNIFDVRDLSLLDIAQKIA